MAGKPTGGFSVSKGCAVFFCLLFVGSLVAVGLLVYFLADRPYPQAPDVTNNTEEFSAATPRMSSEKRPSETKVVKNNRLPRTVLPRHYDIRLLPILQKGNFSILGRVSIDVECKEYADRIVMHSADIVVDQNSIRLVEWGNPGHKLTVDGIDYDTDREFLTIRLSPNEETLAKGRNYTLSMEFVGVLNDQLKGLYRSSYTENGEEKFVAIII